MAMVSDRPDPSKSDVVLQLYDLATKKSTVPKVAETPPLGHQDPAWRPDGKVLLYVRNNRNGARGAPVINRLDVAKGKASDADRPGLPRTGLLAGWPLRRRDQDQQLRERPRDPRRRQRPRAPAPDQRRGVVGAGLVADRRRDRVPPHRGPDRRPQADPARGRCPELDGQGRHRPDRGLRARRFVPAWLVRPARPAPGTDPDARCPRPPPARPTAARRRRSDRDLSRTAGRRGPRRSAASSVSGSTRTRPGSRPASPRTSPASKRSPC